jgi:D-glycero-alpha-D-manno-heptose-7-phosphate kinase
MIITRTPLRISLGGGGTDLPSYYERSGHGFLIAAAITKYVYVSIHQNFDKDILLKYSQIEQVERLDDIKHPLLRECLRSTGVNQAIEISSMADIPTGTGLGSSGSFTVGVLKALSMYQHQAIANEMLAANACRIEIEILGEPVGKQDQYVAACGGLSGFTFHDNGTVDVVPLNLSQSVRNHVDENLLLFYTGVRRSASEVLQEEQSGTKVSRKSVADNLDRTREIGYETARVLESGDLPAFGRLLTDQWRLKFERQPNEIHDQINTWIELGISSGALGGKLVGAGGGGFLLFYADRKAELRECMSMLGLVEVPFGIDYEGSSVIVTR